MEEEESGDMKFSNWKSDLNYYGMSNYKSWGDVGVPNWLIAGGCRWDK